MKYQDAVFALIKADHRQRGLSTHLRDLIDGAREMQPHEVSSERAKNYQLLHKSLGAFESQLVSPCPDAIDSFVRVAIYRAVIDYVEDNRRFAND